MSNTRRNSGPVNLAGAAFVVVPLTFTDNGDLDAVSGSVVGLNVVSGWVLGLNVVSGWVVGLDVV